MIGAIQNFERLCLRHWMISTKFSFLPTNASLKLHIFCAIFVSFVSLKQFHIYKGRITMVKYKFNGDACAVDLYQTQFFKTSCLNKKKWNANQVNTLV